MAALKKHAGIGEYAANLEDKAARPGMISAMAVTAQISQAHLASVRLIESENFR
jgi:hypothetical protein